MLNLSALFLSTKRLHEVIDQSGLPTHLPDLNRVDGLQRTALISTYEGLTASWLESARLPTLGELLTCGDAELGAFFTHLGPFIGKDVTRASQERSAGKSLSRIPLVRAKLDSFAPGLVLTIQVHPDNYTTTSAPGEMSGHHRLFVVARITEMEGQEIRAQAYAIGHLHNRERRGVMGFDAFDRLQWQMEVFPMMLDSFAKMGDEPPPTAEELKHLLTIPETDIKHAFASILGEPFVPNDWGGERSDLVSTQLKWNGKQFAAALAFKGPAKSKRLTMADLGKNGDQISRLYSEPADIFLLQHCHEVASAVRDHMRAFSTRVGRLRPFCIIDGGDTVRILRAYERLGFERRVL